MTTDAAIAFLMASTVQAEIARHQLVLVNIPALRDFSLTIFLVYSYNKTLSQLLNIRLREIIQFTSGDNNARS